MKKILPSVCSHDCPDTCGLLIELENNELKAIKGDPDHPFTQGYVCHKMSHYIERVLNPKRLTSPLIRNNSKSENFLKASWDNALDLITEKIQSIKNEYGAEAILPYSFAGHMGVVHQHIGEAFFHKLGASKLKRTICTSAVNAGYASALGKGPSTDLESCVKSDFIIIWGCNSLVTNLHSWPFFEKARKNGAKIIVIDPYRNQTAKKADQYIAVKPGTDACLAMGLINQLIENDLLDKDFISQNTLGFDELAKKAKAYALSEVEKTTGIDQQTIKNLALAYGKAKAPFIRSGAGPGRQLKGGMAIRAIAFLPALVGAFNKPGGGIFRSSAPGFPLRMSRLTREDLAPPKTRYVNMVQLGDALNELCDPPVKMLYNFLANPAVVAPNLTKVHKGLNRPDLFIVVHEMFMTNTALLADVILPGTSSLEMTDLYRPYGHYYLQMAKPVLKPFEESRSILWVFQELAKRLGFTEDIFQKNEEQIIKDLIPTDSPYFKGIDFKALEKLKPIRVNVPQNPFAHGFQTPSGKVEFVSRHLADMGLDPVCDASPSLDKQGQGRYALQLITPPNKNFLNSSFNEVESLAQKAQKAFVLINPQDAQDRDIKQNQLVEVYNDRGKCLVEARITEDTYPGVLVMEGLFKSLENNQIQGANFLTSQNLTDMGESCAFHCNLAEVRPMEQAS